MCSTEISKYRCCLASLFFEANTQIPYEIAPSPSVDIRLLNVNDMNMTGLKFFIIGGFRTQYTNIVRNWGLPLHSVNMSLRGGAGLLHILETGLCVAFEAFLWYVLHASLEQRLNN